MSSEDKYRKWKWRITTWFLNLFCIGMGIASVAAFIKSVQEGRSVRDAILLFVMTVVLLLLNNKPGTMLFEAFLKAVANWKERKSEKKAIEVYDLNSALHMLSNKNGVVVWDTLFSCPTIFFFALLLVPWGKKDVIFGFFLVNLLFLVLGHLIGTKIWKSHRFEKRLIRNSRLFINIEDENAFLREVEESVGRGIRGASELWLLTDAYIIGRLSDISFSVVAIPCSEIVKLNFYYDNGYSSVNRLRGILKCGLKNGSNVEFSIGRAYECDSVIRILKENGITLS